MFTCSCSDNICKQGLVIKFLSLPSPLSSLLVLFHLFILFPFSFLSSLFFFRSFSFVLSFSFFGNSGYHTPNVAALSWRPVRWTRRACSCKTTRVLNSQLGNMKKRKLLFECCSLWRTYPKLSWSLGVNLLTSLNYTAKTGWSLGCAPSR